MLQKIISGGQTGADRAALDVAIEFSIPLFEKHHILSQVAGHGLDTVKIRLPLIIDHADADCFLKGMDKGLKDSHKFPGSAWTTVKNLGLRTVKTA